ncbi:MAG: hypothetical protein ACJ8AW_50960 [Rhodopila sp.]|jgi:hypothetical protein
MSNTSENLGRPVAWQIRDIPESIRDAVVEQARVEKVNVAELVTRLVLEARAAGWSFNAANGFANASNRPDPARVRAASELLGNMGRAGVPVQKGVAALFNRLAKREARELLGMDAEEPRKLRKKALPAPANPSTDEIVQPPVTHNGDIN